MRRPLILSILALLLGCKSDEPKPEQEARTLQPYAVHTLPLGIRLDSLQKVLHGHSALFTSVVENRLYRIIPLNAYDNQGFGAVELFPDSTIRTYYWYSSIGALTAEQQRYYSAPRPAIDIKSVLAALTSAYGQPQKLEPYPNEAWYTWRNDSASVNLTLQNNTITLTKTGPSAPIVIDTSAPKPEAAPATRKPVSKPAVKPRATVKKKVTAKKPVTKSASKKAVVKKPVTKKTTKRR